MRFACRMTDSGSGGGGSSSDASQFHGMVGERRGGSTNCQRPPSPEVSFPGVNRALPNSDGLYESWAPDSGLTQRYVRPAPVPRCRTATTTLAMSSRASPAASQVSGFFHEAATVLPSPEL